jgi:hypothetical protein
MAHSSEWNLGEKADSVLPLRTSAYSAVISPKLVLSLAQMTRAVLTDFLNSAEFAADDADRGVARTRRRSKCARLAPLGGSSCGA